jgi:hypothetical protein
MRFRTNEQLIYELDCDQYREFYRELRASRENFMYKMAT